MTFDSWISTFYFFLFFGRDMKFLGLYVIRSCLSVSLSASLTSEIPDCLFLLNSGVQICPCSSSAIFQVGNQPSDSSRTTEGGGDRYLNTFYFCRQRYSSCHTTFTFGEFCRIERAQVYTVLFEDCIPVRNSSLKFSKEKCGADPPARIESWWNLATCIPWSLVLVNIVIGQSVVLKFHKDKREPPPQT